MLERVESNGAVLGIIIRRDFGTEGINFVTPGEYPLQVGVIRHAGPADVKPHVHNSCARNVTVVQEVVHIEYGSVIVDFYTEAGQHVSTHELGGGDTVMFVGGAHGLNMRGPSKLIEVKQGPYLNVDDDKRRISTSPAGGLP